MLIRKLHDQVLAALVNGNYFGCLDRQLREFTLLDLLLKLSQIDVRGVLAAGIDELIDKERARNDEQPKDDLSCRGTQNLPASIAHDTVNAFRCRFLTVPVPLQTL